MVQNLADGLFLPQSVGGTPQGPRYMVDFNKLVLPRFSVDVNSLQTCNTDLKKVFSDLMMKDMLSDPLRLLKEALDWPLKQKSPSRNFSKKYRDSWITAEVRRLLRFSARRAKELDKLGIEAASQIVRDAQLWLELSVVPPDWAEEAWAHYREELQHKAWLQRWLRRYTLECL